VIEFAAYALKRGNFARSNCDFCWGVRKREHDRATDTLISASYDHNLRSGCFTAA